MAIDLPIESLPNAARRVLDPSAPPKLRELASKGTTPGVTSAADQLSIVVLLSRLEGDPIAAIAADTLKHLPGPLLAGAIKSDLPAAVIDELAHVYVTDPPIIDRLLAMPQIAIETVAELASIGDERIGELIAINETRLLASPEIIERLYMNPSTRMSTADRIIELAVRNKIELKGIPVFEEAAQAIQEQLIAEPTDEATPEDLDFVQTAVEAEAVDSPLAHEEIVEIDEEGKEQVATKHLPLHAMLASLSISGRIRRAMLGTGAERALLMRDTNKLVASAAIRSPQVQEPEVVRVSASRQVHDEVLRYIAQNGDWLQNHQVKINLVGNPRTPLSFAMRLVPYLRDGELKSLAKSRDVPGAIKLAIKQQMQRKSK